MSHLLPIDATAGFELVVFAGQVECQFLEDGPTEVVTATTRIVEDTDEAVDEFHLDRFPVRQMVVHLVLADTLEGFAQLAVHEGGVVYGQRHEA